MAKRKRLAQPNIADMSESAPTSGGRPDFLAQSAATRSRAPAADMVGAASATAALEELSNDIRRAQSEGRMVIRVPLEKIDIDYLVRDRILIDEDDFAALEASIEARGQQTPLDVVSLGGGRYGLISGLRRMTALERLLKRTGEARFSEAYCLVRQPADSPDAYLSMVEENEIRSGLSFYERAAIVSRAAGQGVFPNINAALRALFGTASKSKRSKIGSFVTLFEQLNTTLAHPTEIPERVGLALAKAIEEDNRFVAALAKTLDKEPDRTAARERALLDAALRAAPQKDDMQKRTPSQTEAAPGIFLQAKRGKIVLSGSGVNSDLSTDLEKWLSQRSS